jgi:serine/threonine-protein kinase HipA
MARKRISLAVLMNGRRVGGLARETNGAVEFQYDLSWLAWPSAMPVSLSMPLREDRYAGATVTIAFDNLLPDNLTIRRHIAERVGAEGTDAFSLLNAIGRDCVGALQFISDGSDPGDVMVVEGEPITDRQIENIIRNLGSAPLGTGAEPDFRISIAGVQEKTALLRHGDRWLIPRGATPTTHILKPAIGRLGNGLDLTESVENEHFCLTFLAELGVPVARSEITAFGKTRVLVVERFDRIWTGERLIRRPQEDMCQTLGVPWTQKYENEGGPGIHRILTLLKASDEAERDRTGFLTAQILFWLLGATDGHAKNFSLYLLPGNQFTLAPLYDVLSAQPNVDKGEIRAKGFKLAMAVGDNRHYPVGSIVPRHYYQMADKAGLPKSTLDAIFARLSSDIPAALERTLAAMPKNFPSRIAESIAGGVTRRLGLVT